jgi:hypothetical protein
VIAWLSGLGRAWRLSEIGGSLLDRYLFWLRIFNAEIAERGAEIAEKEILLWWGRCFGDVPR